MAMTIMSRDSIRIAVSRALLANPEAGEAAAIQKVAEKYGYDPATVHEVLQFVEEQEW